MKNSSWTSKLVPLLMVAGVISLLITLLLGGFIAYQWVLASEATVTALVLFGVFARDCGRDTRKLEWPPLLPLAIIFASGGAKSFYVASGRDTPALLIVVLLASVAWFIVSWWKILREAPGVSG